MLLNVDNQQSFRMLRQVVEARPGSFDPAGSSDDPSQALPLKRILSALNTAGLHICDVISVPEAMSDVGVDLAQNLFASGLQPLDWLATAPVSRFWLTCTKIRSLPGSVLIAGGTQEARACTERCVREFLPAGWEVLTGSAHRECAQWNRAVSAARGELVWFLRGGATPSAELFIELSTRAGVGPTTCGSNGEPCNPGDIAGMMLQRTDVLLVGPLSETIINTPVALEDYSKRLGSKLPPVVLVAGDSRCPTAVAEDPASFVLETEQLVNRWAPLESDAGAAAPNHAALVVSESVEVPCAGRGQFAKVIKR